MKIEKLKKSGKPEIPVYHYGPPPLHPFLTKFDSYTQARNYFGLKPGSLFSTGDTFREMADGTFITKERIGRGGIIKARFIHNSVFCKKLPGDKPVEVLNALGEKIGEFRSLRELLSLCSIPKETIKSAYYSRKNRKRNNLKELTLKIAKQSCKP